MGRRHALASSLAVALALGTPARAALAQEAGKAPASRLAGLAALEKSRGATVDARWDAATGTPARIRFSPSAKPLAGSSPEECATRLLADEASAAFSEAPIAVARSSEAAAGHTGLVVRGTRDLGHGRVRVDFEQVVGGVSVHGSMVHVELEQTSEGSRPVHVLARYFPDVPPAEALGSFSADVEGKLLERFPTFVRGKLSAPTTWARTVACTADGHKLAFAVDAHVASKPGEPALAWRILVDARTGEELSRYALTCGAQAQGVVQELNPALPASSTQPLAGLYVYQGSGAPAVTDANGNYALTGNVSLSADAAADPGLAGPQLHVFVDGQTEITYSGPASFTLGFSASDYHAHEVSAWWNAITFNEWASATFGPQMAAVVQTRLPILIDSSFGNAFYSPTPMTFDGESFPGYADLGIFGSLSTALDDTVLRHEHSHGLWQQLASLYGPDDQYGVSESLGINEGMADYFPCAFDESPILGAGVGPGVGLPYFRDLSKVLVWPQDNNGDPHRVGNIFAGALWEARSKADAAHKGDRLKIDQAVFQGVLRFGNSPSLLQGRDAVIAGDQAANNGAFVSLLEQCFFEHGIGPAPTTPPGSTPTPMPSPAPSPSPSPVAAPSPTPTPAGTTPGGSPGTKPGTTTKPKTGGKLAAPSTAAGSSSGAPTGFAAGSGGSGGGCELSASHEGPRVLWPLAALALVLVRRRRSR